jgi:hypothetical protein
VALLEMSEMMMTVTADKLTMWTVYKHPSDYPDKYVARQFIVVGGVGPKATHSIMVAEDLEALRDVLAFEMHLVCLMRNEEDDPVIVETWL